MSLWQCAETNTSAEVSKCLPIHTVVTPVHKQVLDNSINIMPLYFISICLRQVSQVRSSTYPNLQSRVVCEKPSIVRIRNVYM